MVINLIKGATTGDWLLLMHTSVCEICTELVPVFSEVSEGIGIAQFQFHYSLDLFRELGSFSSVKSVGPSSFLYCALNPTSRWLCRFICSALVFAYYCSSMLRICSFRSYFSPPERTRRDMHGKAAWGGPVPSYFRHAHRFTWNYDGDSDMGLSMPLERARRGSTFRERKIWAVHANSKR